MRRLVPALIFLFAACYSGPRTVERSRSFRSNISAEETTALIALSEQWLRATDADVRRVVIRSVDADGPMAMMHGCALPHWYSVTIMAVKQPGGWEMHSWQVDTDGLHGPPLPCP